ncbi:MAG: UxaA family hydrolase [Firmicutes bacterium]|jgi:altronate dehydratase small subunit|nr:UxaA family hydrolase [Bacillota bacterium]
MNDALKIDRQDNVAVVIRPVKAGEILCYTDFEKGETQLTACTDIPIYHKISLLPIPQGTTIVKYGEHIGQASCHIPVGAHVHTHNVASVREDLKSL